ncbi:MAG: hypothetical protein ACXVLT_14525, partial [Flavisolibacter sp.]
MNRDAVCKKNINHFSRRIESKMCLPARCGVIVVRCFFKKKVETKTNIIASTKHFFYTCISSETN